jgi:hypothetical protein
VAPAQLEDAPNRAAALPRIAAVNIGKTHLPSTRFVDASPAEPARQRR